jgi:TRAP-type C4-dicarboxylate transport system permease small subunit
VIVSAVSAIVIMILGSLDTLTTAMLNWPVPAATELASAFLAVCVFGAMAYAQQERQNIVVDIVARALPARVQKVVDILAVCSGAVILGLIGWRAWSMAIEAVALREIAAATITFPLYPFKVLVAITLTVACLEFARQAVVLSAGFDDGSGKRPTSIHDADSAA